jgi:hypothetical protein
MTTFDLWSLPWREEHGVQGQLCDILRPQLAMNRFLPLWPHSPTLWIHTSGKGGGGGALILDRCRAFDLFVSVDAHLWSSTLLSFGAEIQWPTLKSSPFELRWSDFDLGNIFRFARQFSSKLRADCRNLTKIDRTGANLLFRSLKTILTKLQWSDFDFK